MRNYAFYLLGWLFCTAGSLHAQSTKSTVSINFPDGTPLSSWLQDDRPTSIETLGRTYNLRDHGIISSTLLVQTEKIQQVIDEAARQGGGVIVVPEGIYKSGALFFRQGTHLHLVKGAVLLGSEDILDFPLVQTRIEGEVCKYFPALINVEHLNGFTLSGEGTIDGNGSHYWQAFRLRRQWNPHCTNKDEMRPRLLYVAHSRNVTISGVSLQNSPFWTSHYYQCDSVKLLDLRVFSPNQPIRSASADGIDLDVCSHFLIKRCRITTNDDGICFKGGKGPYADQDSTNGGNHHILIDECLFDHTTASCITCGSEAIHVSNILIRNCHIDGGRTALMLKMRPDTPQRYEYIRVEGLTGKCEIVCKVNKWTQFFDLKGRKDIPKSYANHITLKDIQLKGLQSFIELTKNEEEYILSNFHLENIDVEAEKVEWDHSAIHGLKMKKVNAKQVTE